MRVAAAAARAAGTAAEFVLGGYTPEFQGLIHQKVNRLLDLVEFFLGVKEPASDGVAEKFVPALFEIGDFLAAERLGGILFLLEHLTLVDDVFVLGLRLVVAHERVNSLANGLHFGLLQNGFAKFFGLLQYGILFGCTGAWHNQSVATMRVKLRR